MPTVAEFERRLDNLSAEECAELLTRAERILGHNFDLLGSGPTSLGPRIDWSCDFKTGRRWPREHISRVPITYPDNSDIKVAWELSRFQHLPLLAAAYHLTGEQRWLDEIRAQLEDWIDTNPVEYGVNWACTMDVAIRAANWVAALAIVADATADDPWLTTVLESLLLHGRFIRTHLEWAPVRGNHYLSDIVGLLCLSAVFSEGPEGREWANWAAAELVRELRYQVRPDGCDHEASIPYHRLVTELFVCGFQAATPTTGAYCRSATTVPTLARTSTSFASGDRCTRLRPGTRRIHTAATGSSAQAPSTCSCAVATWGSGARDRTHTMTRFRSSSRWGGSRSWSMREASSTPPTHWSATDFVLRRSTARCSSTTRNRTRSPQRPCSPWKTIDALKR
jgi:hypothetical protein